MRVGTAGHVGTVIGRAVVGRRKIHAVGQGPQRDIAKGRLQELEEIRAGRKTVDRVTGAAHTPAIGGQAVIETIRLIAAVQDIDPAAAKQNVGAVVARNRVGPIAADQRIGARIADQRVGKAIAGAVDVAAPGQS